MNYKRKKSYWQQDIKKAEYGKAAFKGLALLSGIAYLFYDFFLGGLMFSPFLVIYLRIWEKQYIKKQQQEFCAQFKMSLQSMSSALNVGYSAENALKETAKDLSLIYKKDTRIIREYTYMIHQLNMNVPLEQIWKEFADRVGQEDVSNFVSVFVAAKRAGGDSIEMIRNAVKQICEKIEVKREIEMTMSAKKLEFQVMSVVPFGIIFYMRIAFPDFVEVLYRNFLGIFVMTVCLAVYAGAFYMGKKMIEIEVGDDCFDRNIYSIGNRRYFVSKEKASGMVYEKEQQKYFSDAARCEFTCRVSVLCGSTGGIYGRTCKTGAK